MLRFMHEKEAAGGEGFGPGVGEEGRGRQGYCGPWRVLRLLREGGGVARAYVLINHPITESYLECLLASIDCSTPSNYITDSTWKTVYLAKGPFVTPLTRSCIENPTVWYLGEDEKGKWVVCDP